MKKLKGKVFVGMSGGVDSSVAAALLKQATPNNFRKLFGRPAPKGFRGYDVVGVHLKCFNVDGCAERDAEDARRAAEHLDIPFYTFDYEKEYKKRVVDYMVAGYKKGITPNPDAMCNKEIKFGLFFDKAMELGADYVATGHYVRRQVIKSKVHKVFKVGAKKNLQPYEHYKLLTARDTNKDQSYFLWAIKPEYLARCLFPIGEYKKPQVRRLAEKFGLHNAAKKDSQGICFLGQVDLPEFLKKYIKPKKGKILDIHGNELGEHHGAHFYTIGQRHLGSSKYYVASRKPRYVADKNLRNNTVTVVEGEDHPALYKNEVQLADVNLFTPLLLTTSYSLPVLARVRYRQPLFKATISFSNSREYENKKTLKLVFAKPVKFVAAGQSAVFYRARRSFGEGGRQMEMLGGGIIK